MPQQLTPEGLRTVTEIAARHGGQRRGGAQLCSARSRRDTEHQAQFNHPDLGGMGQWSQGGMIMVGDMFNHGLKAQVDALCNELAGLLRSQPHAEGGLEVSVGKAKAAGAVSLFVRAGGIGSRWWPEELGSPGLDRRPERHAIRLVPRPAPGCDPAGRTGPRL